MSRIVQRPVAVATGPHGRPLAYQVERRWRQIAEIMEEWVYREPWWERSLLAERPADAPQRTFYRVRDEQGAVLELQYRHDEGRWRLYRTFD